MKTLFLTSPNVTGSATRAAQILLRDKGYYHGKIDSIYGQQTGAAARAAKEDLGYQKKNINTEFGSVLSGFLDGTVKPSIWMRRRARGVNHKKYTLGVEALAVLSGYLGVSEDPPKSNRVLFSLWYKMIGPWCAMFVTYGFVKAKSKTFKQGSQYAYVPYVLADARAAHNGLRIIPNRGVLTGDLVMYDWDKDGVADHIGIVDVPPSKGGSVFYALEGNTSGTNPSDGGMVARMQRSTSDVIAFARVTT